MTQEENKNFYDILEIATDATLQDIHSAYIRSKSAYAPDSSAMYSLMSPAECQLILEQIEDAYSILGIPEKRREYDIARGFNQTNTPRGFVEEISKKPDYAPHNTFNESLTERTLDLNEVIQEKAKKEEFKYQQEHSQKNLANVSKTQAFSKFTLNYLTDQNFEQEIENCSEYTGKFLKKIREYKGVPVERMAEMTKISKTYIRNIEADEFEKLPAVVYTRGFVYQYAKCLKLNSDLVATSYANHLKNLKNTI
ncbi:MAG: DnaJ domain-containing protein [Halobacteriovoraceae bacterium]|jgi:DnaJ-class molecular chaperone|nr:DnaJ domain-containing protein [Halobacteriovoraceae bacterium]